MKKILVTCPPMLRQLEKFDQIFGECGFNVTAPNVVQTLSEADLMDILPEHDGWIIGDDPATFRVLAAGKAGRLRAAVKWGVGVDNVDFAACESLQLPIKNTPDMFGEEVADLATCYLIGLARDAFLVDREIRVGKWPKPTGISLRGRTAGILGLGDIGSNIAKRVNALGMRIIAWDPSPKAIAPPVQHSVWPADVEACDFIFFACALNDGTKHILNEKLLPRLKVGVRLINISRGGLIDELALIKGLESGVISSAALDVFENEPLSMSHRLRSYERLIFGSHNGSNTLDAVLRTSHHAIKFLSDQLNAQL